MHVALHVTQDDLTRQEKLDIWVKRKKTSYAALGRCLGVSRKCAIEIFRREFVGPDRADELRSLRVEGEPIPEDLLPQTRSCQHTVAVVEKIPQRGLSFAC